MKICLAQIQPKAKDLQHTIELHKKCIQQAAHHDASLIVFPELSLTGYEPSLAQEVAMKLTDHRLDIFQQLSDQHQIHILLCFPEQTDNSPYISMAIFQPLQPRKRYAKRLLHQDELPYFSSGTESVSIMIGRDKIFPAICYEAMQASIIQEAYEQQTTVFIASVAKHKKGMKEAHHFLAKTAEKHKMAVCIVNSIGFCDNFESSGQSAIWNQNGKLLGQATIDEENLLLFDVATHHTSVH